MAPCPALYPASGHPAYKVETLLTEPSPQALGMFSTDPDGMGASMRRFALVWGTWVTSCL